MRSARTFLSLLMLVVLSAACYAQDSPDRAARLFFQSVQNQDYPTAWKLFTRSTQDYLVSAVASDAKVDPVEIRKLFDANDQKLVDGFWTSFRGSSKPEEILQHTFKTIPGDGTKASVECGAVKPLQMRLEGGGWKVGWRETFAPEVGHRMGTLAVNH